MTELERRALLGDKQAQEECTMLKIVLPCPFCGCDERDMIGLSVYHEQYFYSCESCGCNGAIVYDNENCDYPEHEALKKWNTRPEPPILAYLDGKNKPIGFANNGKYVGEFDEDDF